MDFVEICRKFISFDSSPSHGNKELGEFAASLCREKGLFVEVQSEVWADNEQVNIIVRPTEQRPPLEFLFQTHLDTPDPGPYALWTETGQNPFDAHIIDNKIYGLGSADVKLDFVCKMEAMASFPKDSLWRLPPVLVGTFGEELGMAGALKLIRKNKISAKMALVGEPSDLKIITAGKGFAAVEIRIPYEDDERNYRYDHNLKESTSTQSRIFHGRAAHSSSPHLGESAITKMLAYLGQLPENIAIMEMDGGVNFNTVPSHAFLEVDAMAGFSMPMARKISLLDRAIKNLEQEFTNYEDKDFSPSVPTLNLGLIRTFEDHLLISGSCRLPPSVNNEVYEKWMRDLKTVCETIRAEFRVTDYKRPYRSDSRSMLVRGCLEELRQLQLPAECVTQPSTNEASLFSRIGIECVSFGPGAREGNIHTPHEHVGIDDLKKATEFYKKMIARFCL